MRVHQNVAQALEHPVSVIVGKRELLRSGHGHETRRGALERAVRPSVRIGGSQEEIDGALDQRDVVLGECRSGELLLQAIGYPAAVERILQAAVAVVIHNARHEASLAALPGSLYNASRN